MTRGPLPSFICASVCVCVCAQHYHGAGSCIHHHSQDTEQFITSSILFCLAFMSTSTSSCMLPAATLHPPLLPSLTPGNTKLLYSYNFVISKCYINDICSVIAFWIALFISVIFGSSRLLGLPIVPSCLVLSRIPWMVWTDCCLLNIHLLKDIWFGF